MSVRFRAKPMDRAMNDLSRRWRSMTVGCVLELEGRAPSVDELRRHVATRLDALPRLTHYLKGPGLRPHWEYDPRLDMDARVREKTLDPGDREYAATLAELPAIPLPATGPPWDMWLLRGHAEGRFAIAYRAHHTTHDGAGVAHSLHTLFAEAEPKSVPHNASGKPGPAAFRDVAAKVVGSLAVNNIWNDPNRPMHGTRTDARIRVSTDSLRPDVTVPDGRSRDTVLARLTAALRTWSEEYWPPAVGRPIPALAMVDLHRADEVHLPGNLFTFAPFSLPCHLDDPARQWEHVIAAARTQRDPRHRAAMRVLHDVTPARVLQQHILQVLSPPRAIVCTSHLSVYRPLSFQGAPVTEIVPFSTLPSNCPISMFSGAYNGVTNVFFAVDTAFPGLHELPRLWQRAAVPVRG